MAWRLEKNGDDTEIVIDGWEKGIAQNPYDGVNFLYQTNISTVPGEVNIGFPATTATVSGATLDRPVAKATQVSGGSATAYYICDRDGRVFSSSSITGTWTYLSTSNTTTSNDNNIGLAFWKGYLFKFQNDTIYYYSGGTWTTWAAVGSIGAGVPHAALVGRDDVLYFCNGSGVGSIIERAGSTFDPATSSTYTFNSKALALPSFDEAVCLEEQALNLLVGGSQDAVYVWDRINPTFFNRIFLADYYVKKMVKANTNVYIFTGNVNSRGRIYVTNGSQADLFYKFPDFLLNRQEPYYRWGDAIYYRNKLVFGFEATDNAGTSLTNLNGVWSIDLDSGALSLLTALDAGANASVIIPDQSNFAVAGMAYMIGSYTSGSSSISYSNTSAGTGTATVYSDYIPVGTFLKKRTFKQVEVKLYSGLQANESVRVDIQNDKTSAQAGSTFTTTGEVGMVFPMPVQGSQWLQVQLTLTGASTAGVRVREVRIR